MSVSSPSAPHARPVLANDFVRQWAATRDAVHAAVERVGASGWWILGKEVAAFESALAEACGVAHVVGVANGLDALEIALRCADLPPGSEVLTTPLSAFATALAIVRAGHVPVFSDVDASGLLDLARADEAIAARPTIRAILPVHLYGHAIDLAALEALAARRKVVVIEDCAQALGASSRGRAVGTVGLAAGTSFYPTKNLGAIGDGGALLTVSATVRDRARVLRDYGQSKKYVHDQLGANSRLDELHAAILRDAHLPHLATWTARRAEIAARYRDELRSAHVVLPPVPEGSASVFHLFPVLVRERDAFLAHLAQHGVGGGVHYPVLMQDQKALPDARVLGDLPTARRFAAEEASLPIHPFLDDPEITRVVEVVHAFRPLAPRSDLTRPCSPS